MERLYSLRPEGQKIQAKGWVRVQPIRGLVERCKPTKRVWAEPLTTQGFLSIVSTDYMRCEKVALKIVREKIVKSKTFGAHFWRRTVYTLCALRTKTGADVRHIYGVVEHTLVNFHLWDKARPFFSPPPFHFSSIPLEVGFFSLSFRNKRFNLAKGSGECCKLLQRRPGPGLCSDSLQHSQAP